MKMNKTILVITLLITIILTSTHNIVYSQEGGFIVKEKLGEWEVVSDVEIRSGRTSGESLLIMEYPKAILGSWQGNIDVDASGEPGDNITILYTVEIEEIKFKIEYYESYVPGYFGPIGEKRMNRLTIYLADIIVYNKIEVATWPYDTRLNTRIYYTIYRSGEDSLRLTVQDYYGQINENKSIYWSDEILYNGNEVTLRISIWKRSDKPSQIMSYLFYNEVIENEIYEEQFNARKLNIDMNIIFYLSLGFLVVALSANIFTRVLTPKVEIRKEEKPIRKKSKKRK
jgi:hypothetical protein